MGLEEKKFVWDDFLEGLTILGVTEEENEQVKSRGRKLRAAPKSKSYCPHQYLILNFLDVLNPGEQIKFRKVYQRKVAPNEPDVIILQDIKNLVLFLMTSSVSLQFINFFHLESVDRFLRALIIYFQFYIEIWEEEIIKKRAATMKKIQNPLAGGSRIKRADEMNILRCLLGREYCGLVVGCDESAKFHHMLAGTSATAVQSQGEKDLRIWEVFIAIVHRIIWIALKRKYFTLIEVELHRLLRTDAYNTADQKSGGIVNKGMLEDEIRIIHGPKMPPKRKLLKNSPLPYQLVSGTCDYRVLTLGLIDFQSNDPRVTYLKNALLADEEDLLELGIRVGILGHSRSDYDVMLAPLEEETVVEEEEEDKWQRRRSSMSERTRKSKILEKQLLGMPVFGENPEIHETFPNKLIKPKWNERKRIRERSRKLWISRELKRQSHPLSDTISIATTIASEN